MRGEKMKKMENLKRMAMNSRKTKIKSLGKVLSTAACICFVFANKFIKIPSCIYAKDTLWYP